jgi:DNA polymerase-3 subunit beta
MFDSSMLRRIVHRTAFAVSADELRPAMMGVLFQSKEDEFRCVSTDGHRLVRLTLRLPSGGGLKKDIIIPAKALTVVSRLAETGQVEAGLSDTHVRFSFESTVLVSRLIDETYPNYESVIPTDNTKTLSLRREDLIASIRRVALYSSATTHQIRLAISASGVEVSAQDVDFGGEAKETLPGLLTGEPIEIGFNATYLVDILTHLDGDEVHIKFSSPTRAAIVTPGAEGGRDGDVLMLVMPVRLTG